MSRSPVFWNVSEAVGASAVDDIFSGCSKDEARGDNFALKASTENDATVKENNTEESKIVFIMNKCCIISGQFEQKKSNNRTTTSKC
mmetsp:Transcript_18759/g.33945  ORF Transcript_18759/g.33945 Transcript_18759/m.33945 type:complete len:87 (+) Transcript_18759:1132-1392(+)